MTELEQKIYDTIHQEKYYGVYKHVTNDGKEIEIGATTYNFDGYENDDGYYIHIDDEPHSTIFNEWGPMIEMFNKIK